MRGGSWWQEYRVGVGGNVDVLGEITTNWLRLLGAGTEGAGTL